MREDQQPQPDETSTEAGQEQKTHFNEYFHENEVLEKVLSWEQEVTYGTYDNRGRKISRGSARDIRKVTHEYLFNEFSRAETTDQLFDLYEAVTAYELNRSYSYPGEIRKLIRPVFAKLVMTAEQEQIPVEELFKRIDAVGYRSEMDQHLGRPQYTQNHRTDPYWDQDKQGYHQLHKASVSSLLGSMSDLDTTNESQLELAALKHRAGLEDYDYATLLNIIARDRYKDAEQADLKDIIALDVINPADVELGIQILDDMDIESMKKRDGIKVMDVALRKMVELVKFCAEVKGIDNAKKLLPVVKPNRIETQQVFHFGDLISQANAFRKQLKKDTLGNRGDELEESVPQAFDTLMDIIINYGQNELTAEEREELELAAAFVGDIFTLGVYLKTANKKEVTIGDFISSNPKMSAERLADKLNPHRSKSDPNAQPLGDLRRQFGSVVYWRSKQAGYGAIS